MRKPLTWLNKNECQRVIWAQGYLNKRCWSLPPLGTWDPKNGALITAVGAFQIYEQIMAWAGAAPKNAEHKKLLDKLGGAWSTQKCEEKNGKRARGLAFTDATRNRLVAFAKQRGVSADSALTTLLQANQDKVAEIESTLREKILTELQPRLSETSTEGFNIQPFTDFIRNTLIDVSITALQLEQAKTSGYEPIDLDVDDVINSYNQLLTQARKQLPDEAKEFLNSNSPEQKDHSEQTVIWERLASLKKGLKLKPRTNRTSSRLKQAHLPEAVAHFEDMDRDISRGINTGLLESIMPGTWLNHSQNILITGLAGRGKTWLACAIGYLSCMQRKSVRFYDMRELLKDLDAERKTKKTGTIRKVLAKQKLLIIDNFDLEGATATQLQDLLEVIEDRSQRQSTLVTSHTQPKEWPNTVEYSVAGQMLIDRLMHTNLHFHLQGESMRKKIAEAASPKQSTENGTDQIKSPAFLEEPPKEPANPTGDANDRAPTEPLHTPDKPTVEDASINPMLELYERSLRGEC